MKKILNIILTFVIFIIFSNITNANWIEIVPVNNEAKTTIIQKDSNQKKYVGMFYDSETLFVTIDGKKYNMVKNHMWNIKYRESWYEYYFTGEYFKTDQYNLYVTNDGLLYIVQHNWDSQLHKLDSKVFWDLKVKTVLADEMLGSENLLIWENLIKLNTQIKDINFNKNSKELYIVTSWYFWSEIAIYLYKIKLWDIIDSDKFKSSWNIEKISKNREVKAMIIAKNKVSKLKNWNKYLEFIDSISDEKLLTLEKKFIVILDKITSKKFLTQNEKKIDNIIKYAYNKIRYLKSK